MSKLSQTQSIFSVSFLPWSEKYRPKCLDDFVGNQRLISQIRGILTVPNQSHILLSGKCGLGKTTLGNVFLHELYPDPQDRRNMSMELNASSDRGIDVIRNKVVEFMNEKRAPLHPSTDFCKKLLFMDESDNLTFEALEALRGPLEKCSPHTLVFFMCNYVSHLSVPILSRTVHFRLPPITPDLVKICLKSVLTKEKWSLSNSSNNNDISGSDCDPLDVICKTTDLRVAIQKLQFLCQFQLSLALEDSKAVPPHSESINTEEHKHTLNTNHNQTTHVLKNKTEPKFDSILCGDYFSASVVRNRMECLIKSSHSMLKKPTHFVHQEATWWSKQGRTGTAICAALFEWIESLSEIQKKSMFYSKAIESVSQAEYEIACGASVFIALMKCFQEFIDCFFPTACFARLNCVHDYGCYIDL